MELWNVYIQTDRLQIVVNCYATDVELHMAASSNLCEIDCTPVYAWSLCKENVASLIGLYKNNGAVSCVGIYFLFI